MSPFNAGPGASISFHQYARCPGARPSSRDGGGAADGAGRPHWAKRHTLTTADVHRLYPRAGDFVAACKTWDPVGKFANTHLTQLFGL
jgi:hypothetical protein